MYYKVMPGKDLFEPLQALYIRIVEAEEQATALAQRLGAESYVTGYDCIAGKPW